MLAIYLASLISGGGLLVWSLVAGHDSDHHGQLDGDADGTSGEGWLSALPFTSLTFWTFFFAFFGLTGVALTLFGLVASAVLVAALAFALGFGSGFTVAVLMRRLRGEVVDSSLHAIDFVGEVGRVLLPVSRREPGKVRVQLKGRAVDLIAHTDEEVALAPHSEVVVQEMSDDGAVKVVPLIDERRVGSN